MSEPWIALAKLLLPLLTALLFMLLLCRGLTLLQDRASRTWRNLWFALMYLFFFLLCVARSFAMPVLYLAFSYLFLVTFLVPAVWCDWVDFIRFLRAKNTAFILDGERLTLDKLTEDDVHLALEATPAIGERQTLEALAQEPVSATLDATAAPAESKP